MKIRLDTYDSMFNQKRGPLEILSGGAVVIKRFDTEQIAQEPEVSFSVHPNEPIPEGLSEDFTAAIKEVQSRYPTKRLDVSSTKDIFTKGDPNSISTFLLGIHHDPYGFFVLSTDEPTVFYDDRDGTNPKQAQPGDLVYVPKECQHSSPNPTYDGERTRIKIIPQEPLNVNGRLPLMHSLKTGLS